MRWKFALFHFYLLKETNGIFGLRVQEILFTPINIIVKTLKSDKMTSDELQVIK